MHEVESMCSFYLTVQCQLNLSLKGFLIKYGTDTLC